MNKITILGSGTSTGVPILGCKCRVCKSTDPRNKRLRTSALLSTSRGKTILVDTSPDLRTQLIQAQTETIDAALITHDHADHTHGMDDLRPFSFLTQAPIPVYADTFTGGSLRSKFPYIFDRQNYFSGKAILGGGIPLLDLQIIGPGPQRIAGEKLDLFHVPHGHGKTLALIHEKMAYVVDCQDIGREDLARLKAAQLDLLIIDCLRFEPHQTHLHLDLTLQFIQIISPKTALLTHLGHEMDYIDLIDQLSQRGAKNVFPACDGQSFLYSNA